MRFLAWAAGAILLAAMPARAEDWDFVLVNDTGKEISTIEVSPADKSTWVASPIEEGGSAKTVKPGERTAVHFDKGGECRYDVRATFADATTDIWKGVNLCDNAYLTIRYRNGAPAFTAN